MSEAKADGVGEPQKDQVASGDENQNNQDKVSYETYRRTVDAEKKAKAKADELARKVKEFEERDLAAQGKSQELIESLRSQVKEKEEKLNSVVGSFAYKSVESQLKEEAIKQGCVDIDLLLKAGNNEFSKIEVDAENGFQVNKDDLKRFFETTMQKHPMLFKKSGPKFHDGAPANSGDFGSKDYSKMSSAELMKEYVKLAGKQS